MEKVRPSARGRLRRTAITVDRLAARETREIHPADLRVRERCLSALTEPTNGKITAEVRDPDGILLGPGILRCPDGVRRLAHDDAGLRATLPAPYAEATHPGRCGLAVITDGAAAAASGGDSQPLRASVLEELRWRAHRTWALDWCESPSPERARIPHALDVLDLR